MNPFKLAVAPPPYDRESYASWLTRLSQQYDMSADQLLSHITGAHTYLDHRQDDAVQFFDNLDDIAKCCDLDASSLKLLLPKGDWYLIPKAQTSMCPLCWLEDIEASRVPFYRREWMTPEYLICKRHQLPLVDYPHHPKRLSDFQIYLPSRNRIEIEEGNPFELTRSFFRCQRRLCCRFGAKTLRNGILSDMLTALTANFRTVSSLKPVASILSIFLISHWRHRPSLLFNVPHTTTPPNFLRSVRRLDIRTVAPASYRRTLIFTALLALRDGIGKQAASYGDCFQEEAAAWLYDCRPKWDSKEYARLLEIAETAFL